MSWHTWPRRLALLSVIQGSIPSKREQCWGHVSPEAAALLDCGPQLREQPSVIADEVIAIRRLAYHIGFMQEARTNAVVKPLTGHTEIGRETVNGPQAID
jgi:hypothetical protein